MLDRWTMCDDYLRLLASFEVAFALERPSTLVERMLAQKILNISGGTIGEISALLTQASLHAIESGAERITSDMLNAALCRRAIGVYFRLWQ